MQSRVESVAKSCLGKKQRTVTCSDFTLMNLERSATCIVCGQRYEHLHTLLAHIRKVHKEPEITKQPTCHYCPRIFSGYWMLNKHHFIDHRAEYLKDKSFCCGVCFRHFAAKKALFTHLQLHERWKCPICYHREISQISHDMHLRTHKLGPWAATKKRNIKYRRGKWEATVEISEAEKKLVEGANHYYQRGVGWLEIPSVSSTINSSQDGDDNHPAQEVVLPNAVLPNSRSSEGHETVSIAPEPVAAAVEPAQEYAPPARPKKYKCDRCPGQFNFPKYLLTHIARHVSHETANGKILKAPAQAVLSAKPTEELAKYKNPEYVEEENADALAKRHVCPECAELFHHLSKLNRHRRLEHGVFASASADQEVKCEMCSLSFARQNYLNLHIQVFHTDTSRKRQPASTPVEMVVDVKPGFDKSPGTPWAEAVESEVRDSGVDPVTAYRERTVNPKPSGRRREQGSPQKIKKKRPVKKSSAAYTEPFASYSRVYNRKWTCGDCPMVFNREMALREHKLTHYATRAERDDGQPEWILPDIKLEPQDLEDADWENHNNTAPASPGSDNYNGETQQLPSVRQLKLRLSQSLTTLSAHLRQAAESLPQLFVPLPRVRIPRRRLGMVPKIKEVSTANVTQAKRGTKRPLPAMSPPIITLSPTSIKKGGSKKLKPEVNPTEPQPEPENSSTTASVTDLSTLLTSPSKASTVSSVARTAVAASIRDEPVAGSSKGDNVGGKKGCDLGKNISSNIFYNCPTIGVQKLREVEMQRAIFEYLLQQPYDPSGKVQSLMILSCNTPEEKVALCVSALSKHLNDIISAPEDPVAKIISCTSEFYKQNMANMLGLLQFLGAAGYTLHLDAYRFEGDAYKDLDHLQLMKETLETTVPIQMELDRNLQVFQPGKELAIGPRTPGLQNRAHPSFLEARRHTKNLMSPLKNPDEMRMAEKEVQDKTRFKHIKVRFPDGSAIQGVFKSSEKVGDVFQFVRDNIALKNSERCLHKLLYRGKNLENIDASLEEAQLIPAIDEDDELSETILDSLLVQQQQRVLTGMGSTLFAIPTQPVLMKSEPIATPNFAGLVGITTSNRKPATKAKSPTTAITSQQQQPSSSPTKSSKPTYSHRRSTKARRSKMERRERKKEQNKSSSSRYRKKKKLQATIVSSEEQQLVQQLEQLNAVLITKKSQLSTEINIIKSCIRELIKANNSKKLKK